MPGTRDDSRNVKCARCEMRMARTREEWNRLKGSVCYCALPRPLVKGRELTVYEAAKIVYIPRTGSFKWSK